MKTPPWEFGFFLLASSLDLTTTLFGLSKGLREGNPLMKLGFDSIGVTPTSAIVKALMPLTFMGLYEFADEIFRDKADLAREALKTSALLGACMFVGVSLFNIILTLRRGAG